MSFSQVVITHTFLNPDGSTATGLVSFKHTGRMTNGTSTIMPQQLDATLNTGGALSQAVTSTEDTGTVPNDVMCQVTIHLTGSDGVTYEVAVPSGGGTVDLGSLLPGNQQVG